MADNRANNAVDTLKKMLGGPVVADTVPYPMLPPDASGTDRLIGECIYRVQKLEAQNGLMLKIVWRTSAAIIGLVSAGPAKEWATAIIKVLGG